MDGTSQGQGHPRQSLRLGGWVLCHGGGEEYMTMPSSSEPMPAPQPHPRVDESPNLWYRLSAPPPVPMNASLDDREQSRRGRIVSQIIAGELIALLFIAVDLPLAKAVFPSVLFALVCCASAIALNRQGYTASASWLMVISVDGALIWALLTAHGGLDPLYLPAFYLMVTAALIAAAALPSVALFGVTLFNCLFIFIDIRLQARTMMWDQMISSTAILYSMILGPITLHVISALMAYVWTRSAARALRRADRAEDVARLESIQAEQSRLLEAGIQQILATHLRFASGDLSARAPAQPDNMLWQVSVALNNLLSRYQRLSLEDGFSRLAEEQVGQARLAIRIWQGRQTPRWPQPVGSPLDSLLADLKQLFAQIPPPRSPYAPPSPRLEADKYLDWPDLGDGPSGDSTGK